MTDHNPAGSGAVSPDSFRFAVEPPDSPAAEPISLAFQQLARGLLLLPAGRLRSIALSKLEESFWATTQALLDAEGKR